MGILNAKTYGCCSNHRGPINQPESKKPSTRAEKTSNIWRQFMRHGMHAPSYENDFIYDPTLVMLEYR